MDVKPGYKMTEVGAIPLDWKITRLGRICSMKSGIGITSASIDEFSRYPCFGGNGIRGFTDRFTHSGRFSLIGRQGALCGNVVLAEGKFFASEHAIIVTASAKTDTDWLFFILDRMHLNEFSESSAQPGLSVSKILLLPVACPPLLEQSAIAEVLSDADALIESLEQLLTKKRQIKKGAMQELLTGKKRLPGFSGEWEVTRLGDVATFHKGKMLPKSSLLPFGAEPCIHYGELFTRYPETIRQIISHTKKSGNHFRSVANDVLMPTSDVTPNGLAKASCITMDGVILGGDILVIRANSSIIFGPFLAYLIRHAREEILQLVTGTTVFHLYAADMKRFTFRRPSVIEQRRIVAVLDDMDAEISAIEARLSKARQLKQGMMQELLTGRIRLV